MRKSTRNNIENARLLTLEESCTVLGMGRNRTREWCDRHGATRRLSPRMVRYDKVVINRVLDEMARAATDETAQNPMYNRLQGT